MSGARVLLTSFARASLSYGVLYPISTKESVGESLVGSGTWVEALISAHGAHPLSFRESIGDVLKPRILPSTLIVGARAWLIFSREGRPFTRDEGSRGTVIGQTVVSMVVSGSKVPIASSAVSFLPYGVLDGIGPSNQGFIVIVFAWSWLVL